MNRFVAALACAAFALFGGPALGACDPGGIGGTGIDSGGIGGTGQRADADLGVYGTITGFGSICLNGLEVQYDAATPVSRGGEPVDAAALAVGQVVLVRAVANEKQARARSIQIVDAAVGPADARAGADGLRVAGQPVLVSSSTLFAADVSPSQLAGRSLRVSGLVAADGTVVATRIESAPPGAAARAEAPDLGAGRFSVQGYIGEVGEQQVRVGRMTFVVSGAIASALERDRLVRFTGRAAAGRLVVDRADFMSRPLDVRPERTLQGERRSGRSEQSGREASGSGSGTGSRERVERPDRSGRSERPERVERVDRPDRSGRN